MSDVAVMTRVTHDAQNKRFIIIRRFKSGNIAASVVVMGSDIYQFLHDNPKIYFTPCRNKEV